MAEKLDPLDFGLVVFFLSSLLAFVLISLLFLSLLLCNVWYFCQPCSTYIVVVPYDSNGTGTFILSAIFTIFSLGQLFGCINVLLLALHFSFSLVLASVCYCNTPHRLIA